MTLEPITLVVSALVSAMVSAAVSMATAAMIAGRSERGRRRLEVRRSVRDLVADPLRAARQAALGMEIPPEQARDALIADYRLASRVLGASEELECLRRRAVRRRLRRVVGRFAYDHARDLPYTDDNAATDVLVAGIFADKDTERYDLSRLGGVRRKAFTDAERPDKVAAAKLNKLLTRIARCSWH